MSSPTPAVPTLYRYLVSLNCPTPLEFPELELEAESKEDAWRQFCALNGITDSEHPRTITSL
jgi:hypothetical protein